MRRVTQRRFVAVLGSLAILLVAVTPADAAMTSGDDRRGGGHSKLGHPRIDSDVLVLAAKVADGTVSASAVNAGRVVADSVVVLVHAAGSTGDASGAIRAVGGRELARVDGLLRAAVPASRIRSLADAPSVARVTLPRRARPAPVSALFHEETTSEGVAASSANAWIAAGYTGKGVKIGIVDLGFEDYDAGIAAGELPTPAARQDYCDGEFDGDWHGTAAAEIVHEMAPDAELHLLCVWDELDLVKAAAYAKTKKLNIVTMSVTWPATSRGDGKGVKNTPEWVVADAKKAGILWVQSAGQSAGAHWRGTFVSKDKDVWHEFATGDETLDITIDSGEELCVWMKWDSWPKSKFDYDIELTPYEDTDTVLAYSDNTQSGTQTPQESFCWTNEGATDDFALFIELYQARATKHPVIDLWLSVDIIRAVSAGSVEEPATSASAFSVGTMCYQGKAIAAYSSRGPTIDKRVKPDITGYDSVTTGSTSRASACLNGYQGAGAATPHVAGAAALVKQKFPTYKADQIQSFLQTSATDLGTKGKDSTYGFGKLRLP